MKLHKLTKLDISPNPQNMSAATEEEYRVEMNVWSILAHENMSPNIGYWVVGVLLDQPKVGEALYLDRINRNGKPILGRFHTSTLKEVEHSDNCVVLITLNSVYLLEELNETEANHFWKLKEDFQKDFLDAMNAVSQEKS